MKLRLRDLFRNYALPGAIGFAVFLALTGGRVLDTADLGWLRTGDLQQHFVGWHFFRNTEFWQSPLGSNRAFCMELGSSIVYTDSLPLLAIPLKAIHTWLPDVFQYIGWWILACFLLQAALAWRLIGRFTGNWWLQACATAFFCLSPPFLFRLHGHDALFGHWIVLSALLLYFSAAFFPARWLALLRVAALTHA